MKIFCLIFLNLFLLNVAHDKVKYTKELTKDLFVNYDRQLKPNGITHIEFQLFLIQILNVFASDQTMLFNVWTHQTWTDTRLKWNPNDYGNLSSLQINSEKVWR